MMQVMALETPFEGLESLLQAAPVEALCASGEIPRTENELPLFIRTIIKCFEGYNELFLSIDCSKSYAFGQNIELAQSYFGGLGLTPDLDTPCFFRISSIETEPMVGALLLGFCFNWNMSIAGDSAGAILFSEDGLLVAAKSRHWVETVSRRLGFDD